MNLYEPVKIIDPKGNFQIPTVDDFSPECMTKLQEGTILDNTHFQAWRCWVSSSGTQGHQSKQSKVDGYCKGEGVVPLRHVCLKPKFGGRKDSSGEEWSRRIL